jgi:hypothetical protein
MNTRMQTPRPVSLAGGNAAQGRDPGEHVGSPTVAADASGPDVKSRRASICNCIAEANKALREHNTEIAQDLTIDMKTGRAKQVLSIPTKRINSKVRKGPLRLMVAFCPLCGTKVA